MDDLSRYGTPAIYTNAADPLKASFINPDEAERKDCIDHLRSELRYILETMKSIARTTKFEEFRSQVDRPFTAQFYLLLQMTDLEWLVQWYVERIPGRVQELLGDASTRTAQLLENLPRVPAYEQRFGCYVDLAEHQTTKRSDDTSGQEPLRMVYGAEYAVISDRKNAITKIASNKESINDGFAIPMSRQTSLLWPYWTMIQSINHSSCSWKRFLWS